MPVQNTPVHRPVQRPPRKASFDAVRHGDRGRRVALVQKALQRRGIDPGPLDGIFGPKTERAVRAYQKRAGLPVDGTVGASMWKRLSGGGAQGGQAAHAVGKKQSKGKVLDRKGNELIAQRLQDQGPIRAGDTDKATAWAKRLIAFSGHDAGKGAGFDGKAAGALRDFQEARGLPATGELDGATFKALRAVQGRVRSSSGVFGVGQKDGNIARTERRLAHLGYDVGKVDGVMDADLAAAVKGFRKDQGGAGRNPSGVLTEGVRKQLSSEVKATQHDAYRVRVKPSRERRRLDALTAKVVDHAPLERGGTQGRWTRRAVSNVQGHLRAAGFDPKTKGGTFDDRTEGMVKLFQEKSGLPATGEVDRATWSRLQRSTLEAKSATSPAQAVGERSGAVKATEKLLRTLGFKGVKADGLFTEGTEKAVRAFEKKNGLRVDGKVDGRDLQEMKAKLGPFGAIDAQARAQMKNLMNHAMRNASGRRPGGYCLKAVQDYLAAVRYGKAGQVPRLPYARNFGEVVNQNPSRYGLRRLPLDNPYKAPPGAIIVMRPGTPGTAHPTAGDIVVKGPGSRFFNDGEMGYGGPGNFPRGNRHVIGIYVPA